MTFAEIALELIEEDSAHYVEEIPCIFCSQESDKPVCDTCESLRVKHIFSWEQK